MKIEYNDPTEPISMDATTRETMEVSMILDLAIEFK
jgi:hypothetical protein